MNIKVLVFPHDTNPYQRLLYSHMSNSVQITYLQGLTLFRTLNLLIFPVQLIYYKLSGYTIFHLHWLYPFGLSTSNKILKLVSEVYFQLILGIIKFLNFKLIWTIHNLHSHEKMFINDEKMLLKLLHLSDKLIVLNSDTKDILIHKYQINQYKIALLPIGNYIGLYKKYPDVEDSQTTRFLFLGQIRPYKGLDELLDIYKQIEKTHNVYLTIAGKCSSTDYWNTLKTKAESIKNITLLNQFIPDNQIGKLLANCDIVVLPFKEITNTSTAIMVFSMTKPILAPLLGSIKDYPTSTGIYYNWEDSNGLNKSIIKAVNAKNSLGAYGVKAHKYAKTLDWKVISHNTQDLYLKLVFDI